MGSCASASGPVPRGEAKDGRMCCKRTNATDLVLIPPLREAEPARDAAFPAETVLPGHIQPLLRHESLPAMGALSRWFSSGTSRRPAAEVARHAGPGSCGNGVRLLSSA